MLTALTICALAALSCTDEDLTAPHAVQPTVSANTLIVADTLCTKMQFTITSATAVTTAFPNRTTCSTTGLVLIRSQAATWAQSPNRRLTLFVRLLNKSGQTLQLPVRLYLPATGTTVVAPAGTPASKVVPLTPDSVDAGGGKIWFIGGTGTLAANDSTVQDTIKVNVMSPVTQARFQFRATANTPSVVVVPSIAPDSVPLAVWQAMHAPANMVSGDAHMTGPFPRNVILVKFQSNATQSQRQAAVDLIGATVAGGVRIGADGYYYLQIQDDGTTGPLWSAIGQLSALPQIRIATPEIGDITSNYLRPYDGQKWRNWKLNPDSADTENWAAEAIAAPAAWGCSVSGTGTAVGVVDHGFHLVQEINVNVDPASTPHYGLFPTEMHGTMVASILGARGNDSVGMSGILWRAAMNLRESRSIPNLNSTVGAVQELDRLARNGVRIINLSQGLYWNDPNGKIRRPPNVASSVDSTAASNIGRYLADELADLAQSGIRPLIVVAASNDNVDAWWSGTAQLQDFYPNQVLVVGASTRARTLASYSNFGTRVEISAPGDSIVALDQTGALIAGYGTSFAAPMVSGVAGLLLSFDPSLDAASLESLIRQGAIAGGRTAGGIPILNAYESLKLAAKRPKAPLCGNRMWTTGGGDLTIQRGANTEVLSSGGTFLFSIDANHGGKRIDFGATGGPFGLGAFGAFFFADTNWLVSTQPGTLPPGTPGGFYNPFFYNHARDSAMALVYANQVYDGQGRLTDWNWQFKLRPVNVSTGGRLLGSFPMHQDFSGISTICIQRDSAPPQACQRTELVGTTDGRVTGEYLAALSPHEDKLIVAFNVSHGVTTTTSGWVPCPWIHAECINLRRQTDATAFEVWRVDIPATGTPPAPVLIHTEIGRGLLLQTVQVNEDSREFGAMSSMESTVGTGPNPAYALSWQWVGSGGKTNCRAEFRPVATGSPANLIVNGASNCASYPQGTFAPIRRAAR